MSANLSAANSESVAAVITREGATLGPASDYLSEPMAKAVSSDAVQEMVNEDATQILSRIETDKVSLLGVDIKLGIINFEEAGFTEYGRAEDHVVLIPGLPGIESYDVSPDVQTIKNGKEMNGQL